jgi:hypothetical protein
MKRYFLTIITLLATLLPTHAAGFIAPNLLNGSTAKFYIGTSDSATTFAIDDSYNTNRTYLARDGTTTVTPKATNSTTGEILKSFYSNVPLWPTRTGESLTNLTISATVTANSSFTNTVALYFARSANNGTDFDTTQLFSFTITPVSTTATTLTTNLPLSFISGSSHIQLYKVITAANPTDGGILTLNRCTVGGFSP